MIQNLRNMKTLLKSSLMSDEVKFKIAHSNKNFIDLDVSIDSSSDGNDDDDEEKEEEEEEIE
jgi:hypothetical protein